MPSKLTQAPNFQLGKNSVTVTGTAMYLTHVRPYEDKTYGKLPEFRVDVLLEPWSKVNINGFPATVADLKKVGVRVNKNDKEAYEGKSYVRFVTKVYEDNDPNDVRPSVTGIPTPDTFVGNGSKVAVNGYADTTPKPGRQAPNLRFNKAKVFDLVEYQGIDPFAGLDVPEEGGSQVDDEQDDSSMDELFAGLEQPEDLKPSPKQTTRAVAGKRRM